MYVCMHVCITTCAPVMMVCVQCSCLQIENTETYTFYSYDRIAILFTCMYVYLYVCLHIYGDMHAISAHFSHMRSDSIYVYKYIHIHIYVYINIYIYIYVYIHIHPCIMSAGKYIHTHNHTHTHIYIYIYIYICMSNVSG
jgi:hypothetical protein